MTVKRLTPQDWIQAAFRALTTGGVPAVKVEPLARALQVSKGSFYWHFKDLADLKAQMIAHWRAAATFEIIDTVEGASQEPMEKLALLMHVAVSDRDAPYGGPLAETAIRAWSCHDPAVAKAQAEVDAARLGYLEALFAEAGHDKTASRSRARLVLFAYLGSAHADPSEREVFAAELVALASGRDGLV